MKKIIFLLAFVALAINLSAQTTAATLYGKDGQTYFEYTTDVTLTNTTAQAFYFNPDLDWFSAQDLIVHLDSLAGNHTNVAVALYGRKSDQTSTWTQVGSTINYKGYTGVVLDHDTALREATLNPSGMGCALTRANCLAGKVSNGRRR